VDPKLVDQKTGVPKVADQKTGVPKVYDQVPVQKPIPYTDMLKVVKQTKNTLDLTQALTNFVYLHTTTFETFEKKIILSCLFIHSITTRSFSDLCRST
jgi:hypothetical protein